MTAPYYQDEFVTLYNGDCLEVDEWRNADVLVTDPPYGMSYVETIGSRKKPKTNKTIANDDTTEVRDEVLKMWVNKPALVFGTWRKEKPANTRNMIVWSKGDNVGMGDLSMPWGHSHEEIYVIGHGWIGPRRPNIIQWNTLPSSNRPNHPTPKPIGLMEQLIECCPPGVIADPFAGSGATLIAARNQARFAIGVELDEEYCELIANRLSDGVFDFDF
jgi:site-specific DNA-methyltransferase (adenine-specific)